MKDLKTLLETSMLDIEDTLAAGDKFVERFGAMYKLKNIWSDRPNDDVEIFDIDKLIKLTKGMYVNDTLKKARRKGYVPDHIYYIGIFIDNLNRKELTIDDHNLCGLDRNDKLVKSFSAALKKILIDEDIFILSKKVVKVWPNFKSLSIYFERNASEWMEFEYEFVG